MSVLPVPTSESQHPDPGSGMNNPDQSFFLELRNHFMETAWIRDGKKLDPGLTSRIRNTGFPTALKHMFACPPLGDQRGELNERV